MGEEWPKPASTPGAVFLSYASQDAEAAKRICDALRAAGIEVWFDQSELRGGDAWDTAIRQQIKACTLFVPVISGNSRARTEGYFRLEWKLAVDRSHLIAADRPFLVPVVIDATTERDARVPDKFREVAARERAAEAISAAFECFLVAKASPVDLLPVMKAAAEKAVTLDPELAEAHAYLGFILLTYQRDFPQGELELARAVQLNPRSADVQFFLANDKITRHQAAQAQAALQTAEKIDPLNPFVPFVEYGWGSE
jgi:tetratricopeptide (TPR) repeat protein